MILLVFDMADAVETDVGERLKDAGDVKLAARTFLREIADGIDLDVLDVYIVDSRGVLADELRGIAAAEAGLVADVKTVADADVALFDVLENRLACREEIRHIRSVIVDRGLDIVFLDELFENIEHRLGFHALLLAVDAARVAS